MQYKVWLKPSAEQSFLYGNHVSKSGLGRLTENMPQYQGVVFFSMTDNPLVRTMCIHVYMYMTALGVLCCFALFVCLTLLASFFLMCLCDE